MEKRQSGRGIHPLSGRRFYSMSSQKSQFKYVSEDTNGWVVKIKKGKVSFRARTDSEDEAAHLANMIYRLAFPEDVILKGLPNPTEAYCRPESVDGKGRAAIWVNPGSFGGDPEAFGGYFSLVDPDKVGPLRRVICWFYRGGSRFPEAPVVFSGGGGEEFSVRWVTMPEMVTKWVCTPLNGFLDVREASLRPMWPSDTLSEMVRKLM